MSFLSAAITLSIVCLSGIAEAAIPFETTERDVEFLSVVDGRILGKPATHSRDVGINIYSVLLEKASSVEEAKAQCAAFKAGDVSWELPNLLTFLGIAMTGGGQTLKATYLDGSHQELQFWAQGENEEEGKILDNSRKIVWMGSGMSSKVVDLNDLEKEILDAIGLEEDLSAKKQMAEMLEKVRAGFPVVCVSNNLKMNQ